MILQELSFHIELIETTNYGKIIFLSHGH